jgi:hypothetical protein
MRHKNTSPRPVLSHEELAIIALGLAESELVKSAYDDGLSRDAIAKIGFRDGAYGAVGENTLRGTAYRRLMLRMGVRWATALSDDDRELAIVCA